MGRFSSVQTYSDSHASGQTTLSYAAATGRTTTTAAASNDAPQQQPKQATMVQPEKVVNPYSSTAGAGSGEFHVYRHLRAREMERLKQLDHEQQEREKDLQFAREQQRTQQELEERLSKRRKKRQRQKETKLRKKNLRKAGIATDHRPAYDDPQHADQEDEEEEFTYIPREEQPKVQHEEATEQEDDAPKLKEFVNDGSFLEQMKKRLAEQQQPLPNDEDDEPPLKRQAT